MESRERSSRDRMGSSKNRAESRMRSRSVPDVRVQGQLACPRV
jgi:hypothetical protein